jgi:hypothetical protein
MAAVSLAIRDEIRRMGALPSVDVDVGPLDPSLIMALRRLSAAAHANGVSAERLLIALRELLDSIPGLEVWGGLSSTEAMHPLRTSVVSACIRAYYAGDSMPGDGGPADAASGGGSIA